MRVRRASRADWESVLALQETNLYDNLDEPQRALGFLSARFSVEQFVQMNADGAVVVAEDAGGLAGYACVSTQAFNADVPIIARMIQEFPKLSFLGRWLASPGTCIYGPVCVALEHRGKGVFRGLIDQLRQELKGRFDTAVAFIAKSNTRSLAAHVDGMDMTLVGDFQFDGKSFWIVAFAVPPESISCTL